MAQQIVFSVLAVITLVSGFVVVTDRNLFHAAMAMMASFLGVAGFYVLLSSGFMAAAQLLVYIGAISIVIIFAIMMTRRLMSTTESAFNSQWIASLVASVVVFALLSYVILNSWPPTGILLQGHGAPQQVVVAANQPSSVLLEAQAVDPLSNGGASAESVEPYLEESVEQLGRALVSAEAYVLPFELASVLLLAALVGSIVIAQTKTESENE